MKLAHIAIAVKDIQDALIIWQQVFGFNVKVILEVKEQKVKVAILDAGSFDIELLEPLETTSTVEKFLKKHGPGLHHLCFEVNDLLQTLEAFRSKNIELIDQQPKKGAEGKSIAFVHPGSTSGVLVELVEHKLKN